MWPLNETSMRGIIKLCYTKVIDASSLLPWDKQVFEDTYREFFMQAQQFDQEKRYETFQQILANRPKADSMHYLVSTAAKGHIQQLNNYFPDVLDSQGKKSIPFKNFRFEIVESSISNKNLHKIAIYLYSDPLIWIDQVSQNQILIALETELEKFSRGEEIETKTVTLNHHVGIVSLKKI